MNQGNKHNSQWIITLKCLVFLVIRERQSKARPIKFKEKTEENNNTCTGKSTMNRNSLKVSIKCKN